MTAPSKSTAASSHYSGEEGERYWAGREHNATDQINRLKASYFLPFLKKEDRLLDFGCGDGGLLGELAKSVATAEGLEVNPPAAERARSTGLTVYGSIEDIPEEPRYSAIISNHCLEHVRDVCSTLESLAVRLKPGGRLVVNLPIDDVRNKHQRGWSKNDRDFHLHTWTPRLWANVLVESGFDPKVVRVESSAWHPKLMWAAETPFQKPLFWMFATLMNRRQLFSVAVKPKS